MCQPTRETKKDRISFLLSSSSNEFGKNKILTSCHENGITSIKDRALYFIITTIAKHLRDMIPLTTIKSPLDYEAVDPNSWFQSETTFYVETNQILFSGRRSLRGLQTATNNATSCFDQDRELNDRCRRALLVQPILIGLFFIIMIYCCWKKSTNDISDSYWCCCRQRRLKRQQQQEMSSMQAASTRATIMQGQIRIADSTPDEQEQRENQQRQLRVMATQRRRERELHQIQLENNARLEKIKERMEQEAHVRRALLFSKFQKDGLEKVSEPAFAVPVFRSLFIFWIVQNSPNTFLALTPIDVNQRQLYQKFWEE